MLCKRRNNTRLKITGNAYFKCSLTLARQRNCVIIFHYSHTMTDAFRAEFFDRFPYVRGGTPFARVNGDMQPGLFGFLENSVERFRLELSFIASQVHADQSTLDILCSNPCDLFGQFRAFVAIDRCDQANFDIIFFGGFLRTGDNPVHHIVQRKSFGAAQGHRREAQFEVAAVIFRSILHRFARDAVNYIRRAIEQT